MTVPYIWWAPSIISSHMNRPEDLFTLLFSAEPLRRVLGDDTGRAAELWHSSEHYVHCVACPTIVTDTL